MWTQIITALGPNAAWVLGFALPGTIVAIVAIGSTCWLKARRAQLEMALKQDMVNRGMTADEIERVVKATVTEPE